MVAISVCINLHKFVKCPCTNGSAKIGKSHSVVSEISSILYFAIFSKILKVHHFFKSWVKISCAVHKIHVFVHFIFAP